MEKSKRKLYESIMMEAAKTVKRMINEAGVIDVKMPDTQKIDFRQFYKLLTKVSSTNKSLLIEADADIEFALRYLIISYFGTQCFIDASNMDNDDARRLLNPDKLNKYDVIVISGLETIQKSAIPQIMNIADSRIGDKKINAKLICITDGLTADLDATPLRDRFVYFKMKY